MKFNIGDRFYLIDIYEPRIGFKISRNTVTEIKIRGNNIFHYKTYDSSWFEEKDCLTKEEAITKLNELIKKL